MMKHRLKLLALLLVILIMALSIISVAYAAGSKKMLEAWYGLTTVIYNNQQVYFDSTNQPFIVNNTTYIPLRKMSEIFNKDLQWDSSTGNIIISDKPEELNITQKAIMAEKDKEIADLQAKVKLLEAAKGKTKTIDELTQYLKDDYTRYMKVRFDISLTGDETYLTVKLDVDLHDYKDEWNALKLSDKMDYIQEICDDIRKEYANVKIDGYIRDSSASSTSKLLSFYTTYNGMALLGSESSTKSVTSLEERLNIRYYDYFSGIKLTLKLDGDDRNTTLKVYVNTREYDSKWSSISDSSKEGFLMKVYNDILGTLSKSNVDCYIYDTYSSSEKELYRYYKVSGGMAFRKN